MTLRKLVFAAALTLAATAAVRAEDYSVVTGDGYAPFTDSKLPGGGIATEVVKRVFETAHKTIALTVAPWKRGYDQTVAAEIDATYPYVPSPERLAEMRYSDPIIEIRQEVFSPTAHPVPFGSLDDLTGHTLCSPLGYALPAGLDQMVKDKKVKIETPADLVNCARMLGNGRAEFVVGDIYTLSAAFHAGGVADKIAPAAQPLGTTTLHLIVSRKNPKADALLAAFNEALKTVKAAGGIDDIVKRATGS